MPDATFGHSEPFFLLEDEPCALLAVSGVRSAMGLEESRLINGDIWFLAGLPMEVPTELQGWLQQKPILQWQDRQMCFALKGKSASNDDEELKQMEDRLRKLWFSLQLLGVPQQGPHWVLWRQAGGQWEVRSDDSFRCWRAGPWQINRDALIRAAILTRSLDKVFASSKYARLKLGIHALWNALREGYLNFRLHHFVQALDGLTMAWRGDGFAQKAELFTTGGIQRRWLKEMYSIRSKCEHCAEWTASLSGGKVQRQRRAELRLWQVQNLALYAYCRVLSDKRLLAHFRTDSTIEAFWKLPAAVQRKIWGAPLDLSRFAYKTDSGTEYLAVTGNNPSSIHSHLCLDELLKRYSRYREKEQEA